MNWGWFSKFLGGLMGTVRACMRTCVRVRAYMGVGPIMVPDFLLLGATLRSQETSGSVSWECQVGERDTQRPC